jgi:hypothetical protein
MDPRLISQARGWRILPGIFGARLRYWGGFRKKDAADKLMESVEWVYRAGGSSDTKGAARAVCEDLGPRAAC